MASWENSRSVRVCAWAAKVLELYAKVMRIQRAQWWDGGRDIIAKNNIFEVVGRDIILVLHLF